MINAQELNLPHYNILIAQEDWLYQILNILLVFQLGSHNWVDPQSTVSWRVIEADKVKPNRLQDILFTGTGKKGIIINLVWLWANSIKIWNTVERRIGEPFKFCNSTPLWHNFNLYAEIVHLSNPLGLL